MHIIGLWLQQGRPPRWHSGKESTCQCRRCKTPGFNPWVRKILRSWNWQPIPVFLPGKLDGQSSQTGYSPWGQKESTQLSDWACMHNYNRRFHCDRKSSVQFSSVIQLCPTLWTHGLKHIRPPYPSLTPGVYSNSCPFSRWCPSKHIILHHPLLLSPSVSSPSSRSFQMSQFFAAGGQSIGVSASASAFPMNIQDDFL